MGKEFESVEALWSQFEGVLGQSATAPKTQAKGKEGEGEGGEHDDAEEEEEEAEDEEGQ